MDEFSLIRWEEDESWEDEGVGMMQKGVEDSRCYAREREGTVNTEDREACFGE